MVSKIALCADFSRTGASSDLIFNFRNLDGRRLRDIEHEKTLEEQRKRKIEKEREVMFYWHYFFNRISP